MKTSDVKQHMTEAGLKATGCSIFSSNVVSEGGLGSDAVVESFLVMFPDNSEFLITVTRVHTQRKR